MNDTTGPDPTPGGGHPSGAGVPPVPPPARQPAADQPVEGVPPSVADGPGGLPSVGGVVPPGAEAVSIGWDPAYAPGQGVPAGASGTSGFPHPAEPAGVGSPPPESYPGAPAAAAVPGPVDPGLGPPHDPASPPHGSAWHAPGVASDPAWWRGQPVSGEPAAVGHDPGFASGTWGHPDAAGEHEPWHGVPGEPTASSPVDPAPGTALEPGTRPEPSEPAGRPTPAGGDFPASAHLAATPSTPPGGAVGPDAGYGPGHDPGLAADDAWRGPDVPADLDVRGEPGNPADPPAAPGDAGLAAAGSDMPSEGAAGQGSAVAFAEAETPPAGVFVQPIVPYAGSSLAGEEPWRPAGRYGGIPEQRAQDGTPGAAAGEPGAPPAAWTRPAASRQPGAGRAGHQSVGVPRHVGQARAWNAPGSGGQEGAGGQRPAGPAAYRRGNATAAGDAGRPVSPGAEQDPAGQPPATSAAGGVEPVAYAGGHQEPAHPPAHPSATPQEDTVSAGQRPADPEGGGGRHAAAGGRGVPTGRRLEPGDPDFSAEWRAELAGTLPTGTPAVPEAARGEDDGWFNRAPATGDPTGGAPATPPAGAAPHASASSGPAPAQPDWPSAEPLSAAPGGEAPDHPQVVPARPVPAMQPVAGQPVPAEEYGGQPVPAVQPGPGVSPPPGPPPAGVAGAPAGVLPGQEVPGGRPQAPGPRDRPAAHLAGGWPDGPGDPGVAGGPAPGEQPGVPPPRLPEAASGQDMPGRGASGQGDPYHGHAPAGYPDQPFPADPHDPAARYPDAPGAPGAAPGASGVPGAMARAGTEGESAQGMPELPEPPSAATPAGGGYPPTGEPRWPDTTAPTGLAARAEGGPGGPATPRVPEPRRPEPGGHAAPGEPRSHPPAAGGSTPPQVPRARSTGDADPRSPGMPGEHPAPGWAPAGPAEGGLAAAATGPAEEHEPLPTVSYQLRINGDEYVVEDAWLGESLLYVLRERLDLFGTKNACEHGQCGACSVLVDGTLVNACLVLAVTAQERAITTIEGVTPPETGLSDIQDAFVRAGAVQCGFCTPGMIMAVHDLLRRNPRPEEFEIREALAGNLCRCTGYARIFEAVRMIVRERAGEAEE